jgi:hypothetical protein
LLPYALPLKQQGKKEKRGSKSTYNHRQHTLLLLGIPPRVCGCHRRVERSSC